MVIIASQDYSTIINLGATDEIKVVGTKIVTGGGSILGTYKSADRCKAILENIAKVSTSYKASIFGVISKKPKIFKMPRD